MLTLVRPLYLPLMSGKVWVNHRMKSSEPELEYLYATDGSNMSANGSEKLGQDVQLVITEYRQKMFCTSDILTLLRPFYSLFVRESITMLVNYRMA